eukprot:scaffold10571_cov154-Cylindrotheca_fusiformis.AAC.13
MVVARFANLGSARSIYRTIARNESHRRSPFSSVCLANRLTSNDTNFNRVTVSENLGTNYQQGWDSPGTPAERAGEDQGGISFLPGTRISLICTVPEYDDGG